MDGRRLVVTMMMITSKRSRVIWSKVAVVGRGNDPNWLGAGTRGKEGGSGSKRAREGQG